MHNARRFVIVNNGMKDLRGHYVETSVSIAEAAREMGLEPVLSAHVTCDDSIAPRGIEVHRVFTVDHWMPEPPPPPLDKRGLRGELGPILAAPLPALLDGTLSFREYLAARFTFSGCESVPGNDSASNGESAPQGDSAVTVPLKSKRRLRRTWDKLVRHIDRLPSVSRCLRLPGRALSVLRPHQGHPEAFSTADDFQEAISLASSNGEATQSGETAYASRLEAELNRIGIPQELDYVARFRADLEQLLTFVGCSPHDHVFLPTAHGRELVAIHQMMQAVGADAMPTFHLEFRHALTEWMGVLPGNEHPYFTVHKVYFQEATTFPETDRIRLYTDTEELSQQYHQLTGFDFGVLPIPFRSQMIDRKSPHGGALRLAFVGDARDEKGFHWLPDLVDDLMDDYVRPGHVQFLIQASPVDAPWNSGSCEAFERLKRYGEPHVRLVGTDGPLSPEEYFRLVSEVDVLLCPFDAIAYHSRSSGTLAEAIAAGVPTIVPQNTWLAHQQAPGARETFQDLPSFIAAVRKVCDNYSAYRVMAEASKDRWLSFHTPGNLLQTLITGTSAVHKADWRRTA